MSPAGKNVDSVMERFGSAQVDVNNYDPSRWGIEEAFLFPVPRLLDGFQGSLLALC